MIKKLICKLFTHKIDPFELIEYVPIKEKFTCIRCNKKIDNKFITDNFEHLKIKSPMNHRNESKYSVKQLKKSMRNYDIYYSINVDQKRSGEILPIPSKGGIDKFL